MSPTRVERFTTCPPRDRHRIHLDQNFHLLTPLLFGPSHSLASYQERIKSTLSSRPFYDHLVVSASPCVFGMPSTLESTPLLSGKVDVYDRFTSSRKRTIVAVVSLTGLIPCKCSMWAYFSRANLPCKFVSSVCIRVVHTVDPSDRKGSPFVRTCRKVTEILSPSIGDADNLNQIALQSASRFSQYRCPACSGLLTPASVRVCYLFYQAF